MTRTAQEPITRHLEIEALMEAVRWPGAEPTTTVILAGQLLAARRYQEGYEYFLERAEAEPHRPLFLAVAGYFQGRLGTDRDAALAKLDDAAERELGLPNYFRGLSLADLPDLAGRAETAAADLELVLAVRDRFPVGFLRGVRRALSEAYAGLGRHDEAKAALEESGYASGADLPLLTTDFWVTAKDGFHFAPPRLVEPAPGVYVAQGFDFSDFAFVDTGEGIVAVDTGSNPSHARAALTELRAITDRPITHVILTHAHWDHVGGLGAVREAGAEVIAQANFAEELEIQNSVPVPWPYFFSAGESQRQDVRPDRLVRDTETLTVGGVDLVLHPVQGGETRDALVIHLPDRGVLFTGDMIMPYLGAPFFPEGSPAGLFDAMRLVRELEPRLLIHGHTALTDTFTVQTFGGLEVALRDLYGVVVQAIRDGLTVAQILHRNHLPSSLREHPGAVVPYLVMREGFINRVYHQSTGYWKADGEGVEHFAPTEWAAALDLLGGGTVEAFVSAGQDLLDRGDYALALKLVDYGRIRHPDDVRLDGIRRQVLHRLVEQHQLLDPFKFVIYAGMAGLEVPVAR
jgi:glyoxylase-like metal-dependent hydrolase (beta-lactamase superfamily II)